MSGAKYITKDYDPRFLMHDSSKSPLRDAMRMVRAAAKASSNDDATKGLKAAVTQDKVIKTTKK